MVKASPPEAFGDPSFYTAHFMDAALWEPFVGQVAAAHGFRGRRILPGMAGTFPTFLLELDSTENQPGDYIVVKFYGPLFEGRHSFQMEEGLGRQLARHPLNIRSPEILASGWLTSDWQYLVFEHIPGTSIGQVREELPREALVSLARQMGRFMKDLHTRTELAATTQKARAGWDDFTAFLSSQRENCLDNHRRWRDIPAQLMGELVEYIPAAEQLVDLQAPAHLIHADLTADHILGRIIPGEQAPAPPRKPGETTPASSDRLGPTGWETAAIIDWGDCRVGNILYEIVALHFDLFQGDTHLLRVCLEEYGLPIFYQQAFPHKALSMALLHQFALPRWTRELYPEVRSLDELAKCLFAID